MCSGIICKVSYDGFDESFNEYMFCDQLLLPPPLGSSAVAYDSDYKRLLPPDADVIGMNLIQPDVRIGLLWENQVYLGTVLTSNIPGERNGGCVITGPVVQVIFQSKVKKDRNLRLARYVYNIYFSNIL